VGINGNQSDDIRKKKGGNKFRLKDGMNPPRKNAKKRKSALLSQQQKKVIKKE